MPYSGGWSDQPLWIINHIEAMELVYNTVSYMKSDGTDWSELNAEQTALITWLNKVR